MTVNADFPLPAMIPQRVTRTNLLTRCWATDLKGAIPYGEDDPLWCREEVPDDVDYVGLCPRHLASYRREPEEPCADASTIGSELAASAPEPVASTGG